MNNASTPKIYGANFQAFIEKAYRSSQGHKLSSTQKYIAFIVFYLEALMRGDFKELLVNLPGRHLKTFICSVCLPAFMLGTNPSLKFLIVAYDESIAEDIVRQIRDIMQSDWYKSVFKTRLDPKHSKKFDFTVIGGGRVRAAAVRSVTGKGGDIIIFDDPHNMHDWDNDRKKAKVIEAFEYLVSRRDGGKMSRMLVIAHRVAEDDLSDHILNRGDEFKHICLPLYAPKNMSFVMGDETWHLPKGEALRPDAYPPEEIKSLRENHQGTPFWLYYQQGFGSKKDDFFLDASHFPFVSGDGPNKRAATGAHVVLSVDPAQKTESSSRNVIHVYAVLGNQYALLTAFAEKCSFRRLERMVKAFAERYVASLIIIENTARGPDLIEALANLRIPIIPINPKGSKASRFRKCIPILRAKRVRLKRNGFGVEDAADEVLVYPNSAFNDHVDTMTNFLIVAKDFGPDTFAHTPRRHPPRMAVVNYSRASGVPTVYSDNVAVVRYSGPNGRHELPDFSKGRESHPTSSGSGSPYAANDDVEPVFSFDGEKIVRIK
jgi:phage terminase large subunit-like protein